MITSVIELQNQISCLLPEQARKALKRERDEDRIVKILINTLISHKYLAEGFYNVLISMNKEMAASIVEQAMRYVRLFEDRPSQPFTLQGSSGNLAGNSQQIYYHY